MNAKILAKKKRVRAAMLTCAATIADVQKKCKHKELAECEYQTGYFDSAFPPTRVCLSCGLSEDGWGCGYIVLKAPDEKVGRINRDRLYQLREGLRITEDDKGPLLRKEITLAAMIDAAVEL
jgi:hypothetical protein